MNSDKWISQIGNLGRSLFAIPWLVIGIQHLIYSDNLESLVPAYMPSRIFWVYFTGIGMLVAGFCFLTNIKVKLAATCLGLMMLLFILQLHIPLIFSDFLNDRNWTRALQDIAIATAIFILRERKPLLGIYHYLFGIPFIVFGIQHFAQLDFVMLKPPAYLPFQLFWKLILGTVLILTGLVILSLKKASTVLPIMGLVLLAFFLLRLPELLIDLNNPIKWVTLMLELAIIGGIFIFIKALPIQYTR